MKSTELHIFDKGDELGDMHGHQPNGSDSPLKAAGFKPVSIVEIDSDQAFALANTLPVGATRMARSGKQAWCLAASETSVIALYIYDGRWFLTTLTA